MANRDIVRVIAAMTAALEQDTAVGSGFATVLLTNLKKILDSAYYTPPEAMRDNWSRLTMVFNTAVFGSSDPACWDHERVPQWALRAGLILAGEIES